MKHDITIRSIRSIQEVRFTEQNNGEVGVFLTFVQETLPVLDEPKPTNNYSAYEFIKEGIEKLPKINTDGFAQEVPTQAQLDAQEALKRSLPKLRKDPEYDYENIQPEVIQAGNDLTQNLADTLKPLYEAVNTAVDPVVHTAAEELIAETCKPFTTYKNVSELAKTITDPVVLEAKQLVQEEFAPKPEKKRKQRAKVEVPVVPSEPEVQTGAITPSLVTLPIVPDAPVPQLGTPTTVKAETPVEWTPGTTFEPKTITEEVKTVEPVINTTGLPTPEETKAFRTRMFEYTNKILPAAGLVPTEGVGGVAMKIRKYAEKLLPEADFKNLTVKQWETFLNDLDARAVNSAELVAHINKTVGA